MSISGSELALPGALADVHLHILPELDDGAACLDDACAMAAMAVADGITAVVATPHCLDGAYSPERMTVLEAVEALQAELDRREIALRVYPGSELHSHMQLRRLLDEGKVLPLAGGLCVLLEWPTHSIPAYMDSLVFELVTGGYKPIIAHPERNLAVQDDPNALYRYIERGALAQVTAASVTGVFGERVKELAKILISHGMAQFIATDAHGVRGRKPILSDAYRVASEWIGKDEARNLVADNPRSVIEGRGIAVNAEPYEPRSRSWLARLWGGRRV